MDKVKDKYIFLLLAFIMIVVLFVPLGSNNIYGSMTDWVMQHTVFPDYFRTLFYSTGNLTPNLALNLGAGQNAYYFSYNGLLNPIFLLSYLFPFIKMIDYIMIVSILIVIVSAFLIYKWLINNKINKEIAIITSILFLLMNAFFHAHRHLMFINYMPFLIMGLMGIDKYFNNKKQGLFIISVFLMIMTSYYYSVGGLLCLVIYGIYKYIQINEVKSIKSFLTDGLKFLMPMFIGIAMSLVLLVPTIYAIVASRGESQDLINLSTLLTPNFNFNGLLYDNYGIGFTAIAVIALIYLVLHSRKATRFLSSSLLIVLFIPIFMYILNGMLYLRSKVLIPMSPLIIILISAFLMELKEKKVKLINYGIVILTIVLMALLFKYKFLPFYLDLLITSIGIIIYLTKNKKTWLYISLITIALVSNISFNKTDNYVKRDLYEEIKSDDISNLVNDINKQESSFYRMANLLDETSLTVNKVYNASYYQTSIYASTFNKNYKVFFDDIFNNAIPYRNAMLTASSNNIIFETLMGIKYIVGEDNNIPIGYTLVNKNNDKGIYKNDNVFPLGYASSSLMSEADFSKLDYPYRNEALLNNIVVGNTTTTTSASNIVKSNLDYEYETDVSIKNDGEHYIIDTAKAELININFSKPLNNQILFISFILNEAPNCRDGDISITINNIANKLTCKQWLYFNNNYKFEYALSSPEDIDELEVIFSKGHFDISDIEVFSLDYDYVKNSPSYVDKFIVDKHKTKGDIIEGQIDVTNDGYFATTIPYDKGYKIYVNGKETTYEMINKAFIGFPIVKGSYTIKMVYKAPGYNIGLIGSGLGLVLFIWVMMLEKKKNVK